MAAVHRPCRMGCGKPSRPLTCGGEQGDAWARKHVACGGHGVGA